MTEKRKPIPTDGQCTSRFASCRCDLRSGHASEHQHDGAAGKIAWGGRRGRKRDTAWPGGVRP